jgi:GntR family transcriptional regulator
VTDELFLSQNDSRPMYLQIMAQIKQKVRVGDWPAGQPLPSIRELSAATKVSVITVKRAYTELEAEGVIVTQPGRGSFVADSADVQAELAQIELNKHVNGLLDSAQALGLSESDVIVLIQQVLAERKQP